MLFVVDIWLAAGGDRITIPVTPRCLRTAYFFPLA